MPARPAEDHSAAALAMQNCRHCLTQHACPVTRLQGPQTSVLRVTEHGFRVGDVLQTQGAVATTLRIIKSGATMLSRESRHGESQPVGVLGRGTVIGQFALLGRPNPVTHIGILEGRYCELTTADLQCSGLFQDPAFLGSMFDFMAQAIDRHFNWCHVRSSDGVARQLAGALLHLRDLQGSQRVRLPTQSTLAKLLGTTRESITRAFSRLEKNGGLSRYGRYYCDLDVNVLQQTLEEPGTTMLA